MSAFPAVDWKTCACGNPVACSGQCEKCYQRLRDECCREFWIQPSLCRGCGAWFIAASATTGEKPSRRSFCTIDCRSSAYKKDRTKYTKEATCIQCGKLFRGAYRRKLCSKACISAYRTTSPMIPCARCGTEFRRRADRHGYNKYCSRACYFGSGSSCSTKPSDRVSRKLSKLQRMKIVERDKWKCRDCGRKVRDDVDDRHPRKANVDHVIPVSLGGTNEPHNLQCLCRSCNAKKRDRKVVLF